MKFFSVLLLAGGLFSVVFVSGCGSGGRDAVRVYTEVTHARAPAEAHASGPAAEGAPAEEGPLTWSKPAPWEETPGSGFRLVTFPVSGDAGTGECVISRLGPAGGAPVPNVKRWLGQLGVQDVSDDALAGFVADAPRVKTGLDAEALVLDLAAFAGESSMIVAIVQTPAHTYFVKMTGPAALLAAEKERFLALCASLELP